jgi:hypothetical protein
VPGKPAESDAQTIKWSRDISAPLSCSIAEEIDQAVEKVLMVKLKQGEQEGVSKSSNQEQFFR